MLLNDLNIWFYQGKYSSVLAELGRKPLAPGLGDFESLSILQVASLVYLGEYREAEYLYEALPPRKELQIGARFYLGISAVRRSEYLKAAGFFARNISDLRRSRLNQSDLSSESVFYCYLGSAFSHYFHGKHSLTSIQAQKAHAAALEGEFVYGQVVALDLLGHTLCQTGKVRRGIYELETALRLAKEISHGGILTSLQISIEKYQAEFGISFSSCVNRLQNSIAKLASQDTYSKTELSLELSRQLILRGQGQKAQAALDQASELIYKHQNKRQMAYYNLRLSYLLILRGEFHAALALIQSLGMNLDARVDRVIMRSKFGLERKVKSLLNYDISVQSSIESLASGAAITQVDRRISGREGLLPKPAINRGEDPLGDLIDDCESGMSEALDQIAKYELWGLLRIYFKIPLGREVLLLGPTRGQLVVFSGADVIWTKNGVTAPIRKLLRSLHGSAFQSKETLIQKVWSYHYNPIIHDSLIHATIAKLRKLLGPYSHWIEGSPDGYRLSSKVLVRDSLLEKAKTPAVENEMKPELSAISDLNIRQIRLLRSLKIEESIGVKDYSRRFNTCTMTACRDLSDLLQRGYLLRLGKGRATVYVSTNPKKS